MKVGSLFTGYGGLDMAVGGTLAWYAEIEPAACRVLVAHHPDTPNLGDVSTIDWATVAPVDVLTAGYPCQPFSQAGKREGTNDDRHLWPHVRDAIAALRPMVTVLENVDGHRSLGMDVVLGDLAALGLSARWGTVRAADAGAPHSRKRVFIVASDPSRWTGGTWPGRRLPEPAGTAGPAAHPGDGSATPDATDDRLEHSGHPYAAELAAPAAAGHSGATPDTVAQRRVERAPQADPCQPPVDWGKYRPALRRWERVLGRPTPPPTVPGHAGRPRLNPVFVEWMQGLPEGWVTGHGLSKAQCLKMLGNGVVPQQARLALDLLGVTR